MQSYPNNELPLDALLRLAEQRRITAALDLRSDFAAGRIDIYEGRVVCAVFGGLESEAAVHAALSSGSLQVLRGRTPRRLSDRRSGWLPSTILPKWRGHHAATSERWLPSRELSEASHAAVNTSAAGDATVNTLPAAKARRESRVWRRLRLGIFGGLVLSLVGGATFAAWTYATARAHTSPQGVLGWVTEARLTEICKTLEPARLLALPPVRAPTPGTPELVNRMSVRVLVDEAGFVIGARIEHARAETAELEDSAIASLFQAQFAPARCNGRTVSSWVDAPVVLQQAPAAQVSAAKFASR